MIKKIFCHLRSQVSIEFMALVGFSFILFIVLFTAVSERINDLNDKKEEIIVEDIALKVQKELNLAARAMDGYHREFVLPQKLSGFNYSVGIENNNVIVNTEKQYFYAVIPYFVGDIRKEANIINKTGGVIYLN